MFMKRLQAISIVILGLATFGCTGPRITVRHNLGRPVGMGIDPGSFRVGQFRAQPDAFAELTTYLQSKLRQNLTDIARTTAVTPEPAQPSSSLAIGGLIIVTAEDLEGLRHIRRWNPQRRNLEDLEVPSLRRDVTVTVHFALRDNATRTDEVTLETYRSYRTHQDPQIRGDSGLLRPDDPERVPPIDTIARRLVDECLSDFIAMIYPYEVVAHVPLRRVYGSEATNGLHAAQAGDYVGAARFYRSALRARPDDPHLHFNLAIVREAAGDLAAAEAHYRQALELRQQPDELAQTGLDRVTRLRRIRSYQERLPQS